MTPIPLKMTSIPLYSRATTRTEPKKNRARATRSQAEKRFEFKGLLVRSSILEFEFKVEFKGPRAWRPMRKLGCFGAVLRPAHVCCHVCTIGSVARVCVGCRVVLRASDGLGTASRPPVRVCRSSERCASRYETAGPA